MQFFQRKSASLSTQYKVKRHNSYGKRLSEAIERRTQSNEVRLSRERLQVAGA
jgi:hypothetical protein